MKATQQLHDLGQSLWLDNITCGLPTSGTLDRYISELSVTGLTFNPTIFDHAIKDGDFYDAAIRTHKAYRDLLASPRSQKPLAAGAELAEYSRAGIDDEALAADLQRAGVAAFAKSWGDLASRIDAKDKTLKKAKSA